MIYFVLNIFTEALVFNDNSVDYDKTLRSADLGTHYLPRSFQGTKCIHGLKYDIQITCINSLYFYTTCLVLVRPKGTKNKYLL